MDGRNVTELTELTTVSDTDNVLIGQDNTLKRVSFANLKNVLKTIIGNATTTVAGLMAAADKQHLDALQTKLGSITVDTTLQDSATSLPTGSAVKGALADYRKYTMLANEDFDMNSLRTEGLYQIPEGFNHSISNFPITSTPDGGGIIIVNTWGGSYLTQEVQLYNKNEKYYRSTRYDNGVKFNDWQIIALKSDLTDYANAKEIILYNGVDLNTLNTKGIYMPLNDSAGNACTNIPISTPYCFVLNVYKTPNGTVYQELTVTARNKYLRVSYNNGVNWQDWKQI